jgi:hypothetical protein
MDEASCACDENGTWLEAFTNQRFGTIASLIPLQEWWQCMNGAAAISNPIDTQLTAALTGENQNDAALLALQTTVLAFRRIAMRTW